MSDIQGHYKRSDNGEQSFFLIKLNIHTKEGKHLLSEEIVRSCLAISLEDRSMQKLNEDIDFTIEVARYYDKEGD